MVFIRKVGHTTDANDANDALAIKTSSSKPAQNKAQPAQQDVEVAQSQAQGDGCVTCAGSEPLISVPAAAGDNDDGQAETSPELVEVQQTPTPSATNPNAYEELF